MIKLCGMRRAEDISYVNEFRPDYIGMILAEGFGRSVDINTAYRLVSGLDSGIKRVGVFVDTPIDRVRGAAEILRLDAIQLHGNENADYLNALRDMNIPLWKAVRVSSCEDILSAEKLGADMLLLDSFVKGKVGGTGVAADWSIIRNTKITTPFFLAGGINADNLSEALKVSENIDISGGVETDGVKDRNKIKAVMSIYTERNKHHE